MNREQKFYLLVRIIEAVVLLIVLVFLVVTVSNIQNDRRNAESYCAQYGMALDTYYPEYPMTIRCVSETAELTVIWE